MKRIRRSILRAGEAETTENVAVANKADKVKVSGRDSVMSLSENVEEEIEIKEVIKRKSVVVDIPEDEDDEEIVEEIVELPESSTEVEVETLEEDSKLKGKNPKVTLFNKKEIAKEMKLPEAQYGYLRKEMLVKLFRDQLSESYNEFNGMSLVDATKLFEFFEEFMREQIEKYTLTFADFRFKHSDKPSTFREPGQFLAFINDHHVISTSRAIGKVKIACEIQNGKFVAGTKDNKVLIHDEELTKTIGALYQKHMEKALSALPSSAETLAKRELKIKKRLETSFENA